ncbi:MAG: DNA-formamidopyrimidine glycosylase family protein [Planctomycetota bacterium]
MPEGDTIATIATAIAPHLEGRELVRFVLRGDPTLDLAGRRVERVEARGKHLLVGVEGGLLVRTHLGMHGSWHRYAPGESWKKPERRASLVLTTSDDVFVCFDAMEAELVREGGARVERSLGRLGPDLTADAEPDLDAVVARARALHPGDAPLVDVLLDQRTACGVGNVYKSELLFLAGLHPLRELGSVEDDVLRSTWREARTLLRANLTGGPRTTRDAADGRGRTWVYGRAGRACFRCGATVVTERLGRHRRDTFWCAVCQR